MSSLQEKKKKNGNRGDDNNGTTMLHTLSILSCASHVLEARRFLSPVKVQALINLASSARGDVIMECFTVLADGERESGREVR